MTSSDGASVGTENEEALRASRDQLQAILENAADGITVQDANGHLLYANDAAAKLTGYPSAEVLLATPQAYPLPKYEIKAENGQPLGAEELPGRRALTSGQPAEALLRYLSRDSKEERWWMVRARPVVDAESKARFVVTAFQDVSEIKREEARVRYLGEMSDLLAHSLSYEETLTRVAQLAVPELADWAAVDMAEPDGSIRRLAIAHSDPAKVRWARELEHQLPVDPTASTGVPQVVRSGVPEFYPEIPQGLFEAAATNDALREILDELDLTSVIIVPLKARGTTLGAISFVYAESKGHYTNADLEFAMRLADRAALAVDNSRLYRDALAALRVRDEFLSSVSHDLRSPLTTIHASVQLARRRFRSDGSSQSETVAMSLANIEQATDRMNRMIESLLDLSRLEAGRSFTLERERVDAVGLVRQLVEQQQRASPSHQLRVSAQVERLEGSWDPGRLERLLDNLLSNAVKYTLDGGVVEIGIREERDDAGAGWAELAVQDEGIGIPAADLARIFQRFQRGSNVPPSIDGAGIGLAGAKQIAEQHGGTLSVESEEGKGSRFTVRLPLEAP
jgi:PAS domain S-box-containing protein